MLKPSRCVRLKVDVKVGELALFPEGKVVFYSPEKASAALGAGAVRLELGVESGPDGSGAAVAVAPGGSMQSASPWWFVTGTKEVSEANVAAVFFKVTNVAGVDPVTLGSSISALTKGLVTEEVRSTSVVVPVFGEQVRPRGRDCPEAHRAIAAGKGQVAKAITVAHVAKRAKLSG